MRNSFRVTEEMRSSDVLVAARAYAGAGIKVVGLHGVENGHCTCGDKDCKSPGKHPVGRYFPRGHLDSTTDVVLLAEFVKDYPKANIGLVPDGETVIVDIDSQAGERALQPFDLPITAGVKTGRGRHMYFLLKGTVGVMPKLPSVDFRLCGKGYAVAPPSRHVNGASYTWSNYPGLTEIPANRFSQKRKIRIDFTGVDRPVTEGGRNNKLASLAGSLVARGVRGSTLRAALLALNKGLCIPPLPKAEVIKIARSVGRYEAATSQVFGEMSEVIAEPIEWLYEPYIPRACLTILDGDPGLGKTNFGIAIAAALTTGRALSWSRSRPCGGVLLLSAEDDPARVLKPRLDASEADTSRIRYVKELFSLDQKGLDLLRSEIESSKPALVIIDPIIAFMTAKTDMNKSTDINTFLTSISKIAADFDCAILIVRHLRKAREGSSIHQGMGSVAFAGRVRSMLVMARHPDDADKRAVAHTKCNYGKEGPTIVFAIVEKNNVPTVDWRGVDECITGDDLMQPDSERGPGRPPRESSNAAEFLQEFLGNGERDSVDVYKAAGEYGVKKMTLRRAANDLKVIFRHEGRKSYWRLA